MPCCCLVTNACTGRPSGGQFSTIWDCYLNPASRSMYTSRRRLLYYVEPGCEADYKICISVKLIVTLWKTPIYTIFLIYRFLAIWLYKMYHAWLNRPWELSWLLTFSSLNLPLSSSSNTSSELLSQFPTCSEWRWLAVGEKLKKIAMLEIFLLRPLVVGKLSLLSGM